MLPVALAIVLAAAHTTGSTIATSALALPYYIAGILGGVAIVAAAITKFIWPMWKRIRNFLTDWEGEKARDGVPGKPGVMLRLETVEFDVKAIKHEVHLNSGQSIKDMATRTEQKVDDLHTKVDQWISEQ